ncbi:BBSome-interacting protein 1 [Girardinichthys multiradiatus]|uniref:BBSome-interacting protein 1 n=1 Tax=Girardinichthys multiradiatus TaxID=208333 RepID=UPI001FAC2E24|nr:BBSome-interacting protein 1 [Girardinichthys multiradiatus]
MSNKVQTWLCNTFQFVFNSLSRRWVSLKRCVHEVNAEESQVILQTRWPGNYRNSYQALEGQLYMEDVPTMVLCKPKLLPLKSVTLEKLEKMQMEAQEAVKQQELALKEQVQQVPS